MAKSTHLLVGLVIFAFLPSLKAQSCCQKRIVSGPVAVDAGLDGTYTLIKDVKGDKDVNCADGCIYSREGKTGEEYCFKAVENGADVKDEECAAVTGTTASGSQSTLSSDELRKQAEEAAARIKENNEKIAEDEKKIEKAEETTSVIADTQAKLSGSRKVREKRQDNATPKPVAKPASCADFRTSWLELLQLAVAVSDGNINQIKAYIDMVKLVDVLTLCDATERGALATEGGTRANEATTATKAFVGQKKKDVEERKKKVNEDIAIQDNANKQLKERDEATVPVVAASTYAVETDNPAGGATTQPQQGGATSPAGGATSKPPAGGESSPVAGGATSKLPAGGESTPVAGATSMPPSGGEGSSKPPSGGESTPIGGGATTQLPSDGQTTPAGGQTSRPVTGAITTGKPQRNLFDKRSRGSIV